MAQAEPTEGPKGDAAAEEIRKLRRLIETIVIVGLLVVVVIVGAIWLNNKQNTDEQQKFSEVASEIS